jgi:hypothetical protein
MLGFGLGLSHAAMMGGGDEAFHQNFLLPYGAAIEQAARKGAVLSFSRGSNATQRDASGNIVWAPHNLFQRAEEIEDAFWTKNVVAVSADAITAPDGTTKADTLTADGTAADRPRFGNVTVPTVTSETYFASVYAKAGTHSFFQIYLNNQGAEYVNFDLSTGVVSVNGGSAVGTITLDQNGFYRCSMEYVAGGTDRRPFFMLIETASAGRAATWSPAGTESIHFWGVQFNRGALQAYHSATTAAYYGPRFDHDSSGNRLGLLIEEARTNLNPYSEENSQWTGQGTAPPTVDADVTFDNIRGVSTTFTTGSVVGYAGSRGTHQTGNKFPIVNGTTYTASVMVKTSRMLTAGEGIRVYVTGAYGDWAIDITSADDYTTPIRKEATAVATATGDDYFVVYPNTGPITSDLIVYIGQMQFEAGAKATSYIPTTGAAATRAADVCSTTDVSWARSTSGTFYVESKRSTVLTGQANYRFALSDGSANNLIAIYSSNASSLFNYKKAGVNQFSIGSTPLDADDVFNKDAAAYAENDGARVRDGGAPATDASGTMLAEGVLSEFAVGGRVLSNSFNGHLKTIKYWNVRKPNSFLQTVTT